MDLPIKWWFSIVMLNYQKLTMNSWICCFIMDLMIWFIQQMIAISHMCCLRFDHIWLVVFCHPSEKYEGQWEGLSYKVEKMKKCLKPPTIYIYILMNYPLTLIHHICWLRSLFLFLPRRFIRKNVHSGINWTDWIEIGEIIFMVQPPDYT